MIEVGYKPSFLRQFNKLPPSLQDEAEEKINLFIQNPDHSFLKTHKLKGKLYGKYSFSVNYSYRILFRYESKKSVIFLDIGKHDIYN
jgi:addiction module RelE/StbE family toxin